MPTESEFLQQVKDVLSHLYDYPYLESHPLARRYWPEAGQPGPNRAQRLSRLLLEQIEALHPPGSVAKGASRAEYYFLLVYRYVEEWPLPDILQELGYSRRQFFRQQQKAIEMLAGLLREKLPPAPALQLDNGLAGELERFRTRQRAIDLREVAQGVLDMVGPLAEQYSVTLTSDLPAELPVIYGSRTLLRQVLLNILSQLITQPSCRQTCLQFAANRQRIGVEVTANFDPASPEPGPKPEMEPVRHLVESMNGQWQTFEWNADDCSCRFDLPIGAEKVLLIVDDNEAVSQAFRRYLAEYRYQVIGATNGPDALRLAREMSPALITLDVMIPNQDGWEILHALKRDPATQQIPVVICSVLEDPRLARSLGAATYLRKPVGQADLLAALTQVLGQV
ncbi:MAG: response regulator [Anaerolineae bacterium]|nr:response regulator [Anaerolineae bacterium]